MKTTRINFKLTRKAVYAGHNSMRLRDEIITQYVCIYK